MLSFAGLRLTADLPVYLQIAGFVKRLIYQKQIASGDALPSRREIAAALEVNPNTVQKAFRLMEEEGYVITEGNTLSRVYVDDSLYRKIEEELTRGLVQDFIAQAKQNDLSFQNVVALLSELWEKT